MSSPPEMPTPEWYDRQYDPRRPERPMPVIMTDWASRSEHTRARYTRETFAYGPHPLDNFDLYRAPNPKGALVFYHGGYWRSCSKEEHGWIAGDFVAAGISVAVMNYPLCPEVTLQEINASVQLGLRYLYREALDDVERRRLVVAGHSAGGYLAAGQMLVDWPTAGGLPRSPFAAVLAISGLFDLVPLAHTQMNAWLKLDADSACALSLSHKPPLVPATPVSLAVGALESSEFQRQSRDLGRAWSQCVNNDITVLPGRHHFDILDDLTRGGPLFNFITEAVG